MNAKRTKNLHESKLRTGLTVATLLLLTAGCSEPSGPPSLLESLPRTLSVAERGVIRASNSFAFDLLTKVDAEEEEPTNVFISPLSVSMALGMTMNGAGGDTYEAMRNTLGFEGMAEEQINNGYRDYTDLLGSLDPSVDLRIANSTWARLDLPVIPSFQDALANYFHAESRTLDFSDPGAVDVINNWVSQNTNDRIERILDSIKRSDLMFIINAVYFKGQWRERFDPADTRPSTFTLSGGESVQVPTMTNTIPIRTAFQNGYEIGELPYGNGAFTMVVVMPPRNGTLADLTATVTDSWDGWMAGMSLTEMSVSLPRFEMDFGAELKQPLIDMGMGVAFSDLADFTRLTTVGGAAITDVKHKTFLKVDEEGTEAAAVTSVTIGVTSGPGRFAVDRPFLVVLRERFSGAILFAGLIRDPR